MKWALSVITRFAGFVKADRSRFAWEIGIAVVVWLVGYSLNWLTSQRTLQNCQDERTELLRQVKSKQTFQDSVRFSTRYRGELANKDSIIRKQHEDLFDLRLQHTRDSIYQRSLLQSIQRINQYLEGRGKLIRFDKPG